MDLKQALVFMKSRFSVRKRNNANEWFIEGFPYSAQELMDWADSIEEAERCIEF